MSQGEPVQSSNKLDDLVPPIFGPNDRTSEAQMDRKLIKVSFSTTHLCPKRFAFMANSKAGA
jgi:hypothetical protein